METENTLAPIENLRCKCGVLVPASDQLRHAPVESIKKVDYTVWFCESCRQFGFIANPLAVLDAEIIEDF